jgi:probable HAF family extracellular repeat protein
MKSRQLMCLTAITLFSLAQPHQLAAQHTRYKLVDIGTLGGPASFLTVPGAGQGELVLNNSGTLSGKANTAAPDPTCNPNCFAFHAFRWEGGVLTDLGTLPGGTLSDISSINSRGWISGNSLNGEVDPVTGGLVNHAVLWKSDRMIDLGTLGGLESLSTYVTAGGQVVGFSSINSNGDPFTFLDGQIHPFIWENGVMRDLGTLGGDALPGPSCNIRRGDLVTGFSFLSSIRNPDTHFPTAHPFLWQNGKMTDLGTLGGTLVCGPLDCISCANNRGQVAGSSMLAGNAVLHAFLWTDGTMTDLGTLGGSTSLIRWLNDAGEVVGGASTPNDDSFHATLWRNGKITDLGVLDGDCSSFATAINSSGQIVGPSLSCDGTTSRAVLWDHGSIIDLNAAIPAGSGFQLPEADNINDRGEIAGVGLPAGCGDLGACGHVFLLVPCSPANGEDCSEVVPPSSNASVATKSSGSSQQAVHASWQLLSAWRARHGLSARYPGLVTTQRRTP